jgi:hypothetical protein
MVDVLPRQLGHVDEPVNAAEVDEGAEVHDRRDHALAHLALLERLQEVLALLRLRFLEELAAREDDVVAVLVEFDDAALELFADVRLEIAHASHLDERGRKEPPQPDVEDQTALDYLDHGSGDGLVLILLLFDDAPRPLVLGAFAGQDQATLLVLLLEDKRLDLVADVDDLRGVDVVPDRELA